MQMNSVQQHLENRPSSRQARHVYFADFNRATSLPNLTEQLELAKIYFQHCHNQPYCYFHERSFYRRLRDNSFPTFLILAVLATAARFTASVSISNLESSEGERADVYAQRSWAIIMQQTMASGYDVHLHLVQATNLLAVVDFTSKSTVALDSSLQDRPDTPL